MDTLRKAKVGMGENMRYQVIGKDGKAKKIWQNNKLGQFIMKLSRKAIPSPIAVQCDTSGQVVGSYVKSGILNKLSAYGLQVPFITGHSTLSMRGANLITNAGMAGVASRINGNGAEAAFTYIAIGIGATAANVADTTLDSEITTAGGERGSATASRVTTDVTNDTARLVLTFNLTGTFAIVEAGALNAASTGVLLNRQVFTAVNVVSGDSLQVTIDIDVD